MLYFAHSFINDHITVDNYYYLSSLCKNTLMHKQYKNGK